MDLVSVIIPTYNRFHFLLNAIESVKNQTYKNIEIIVVNDKSTQSDYYTYNFEGCTIIHLDKNSREIFGYPCAGYVRNRGIVKAKGKYVAFLDDDDVFLPHKIEIQINEMKEKNYIMSCTEGYWGQGVYDKNQKYPLYNREKHWNYISQRLDITDDYPDIITYEILSKHNIIIASSVILETNFVKNIGGFPQLSNGREDYELWLKCLKTTNCLYIKNPCIYYDNNHGIGKNY